MFYDHARIERLRSVRRNIAREVYDLNNVHFDFNNFLETLIILLLFLRIMIDVICVLFYDLPFFAIWGIFVAILPLYVHRERAAFIWCAESLLHLLSDSAYDRQMIFSVVAFLFTAELAILIFFAKKDKAKSATRIPVFVIPSATRIPVLSFRRVSLK